MQLVTGREMQYSCTSVLNNEIHPRTCSRWSQDQAKTLVWTATESLAEPSPCAQLQPFPLRAKLRLEPEYWTVRTAEKLEPLRCWTIHCYKWLAKSRNNNLILACLLEGILKPHNLKIRVGTFLPSESNRIQKAEKLLESCNDSTGNFLIESWLLLKKLKDSSLGTGG